MDSNSIIKIPEASQFLTPGEIIDGAFYMNGQLMIECVLDCATNLNESVRLLLSKGPNSGGRGCAEITRTQLSLTPEI